MICNVFVANRQLCVGDKIGETLAMLVTSVAPSSTSISRIYEPFLYFPCFLKPQNALSVVFSLFSLNKKTS